MFHFSHRHLQVFFPFFFSFHDKTQRIISTHAFSLTFKSGGYEILFPERKRESFGMSRWKKAAAEKVHVDCQGRKLALIMMLNFIKYWPEIHKGWKRIGFHRKNPFRREKVSSFKLRNIRLPCWTSLSFSLSHSACWAWPRTESLLSVSCFKPYGDSRIN